MKIVHLSDLHLGKKVNEFSMLEDQEYILREILRVIGAERPEAVIIAGDVYDKSVPPAEAVRLFDDFLTRLAERKLQVFIISGNHDSAERIAFGGRLMAPSGVHVSPAFAGDVRPVTLRDEFGEVCFWMLPFIRPANVRAAYEDAEIGSYTDAVRTAVEHMDIDPEKRNILITHQFVTGAGRSDSEDISVGGSDNVDASVFDGFDYVALGHIHGPQNIGSERIRYCGTPLKYSFSEKDHIKSVTVAELGEKGSLAVRQAPLKPRHDLREIRGTYAELTLRQNYEGSETDDYLRAVLTDEEDVPDAMTRLRTIYPNIMRLEYDNTRTRASVPAGGAENAERKSEMELLAEFFERQNGQPMSEAQRALAGSILEQLKEGEA